MGLVLKTSSVDALLKYLALTIFVVDLIFGGGTQQGLLSDLLPLFVSLPLIAMACLRLRWTSLGSSERWSLGLLAAVLILPLLQLIPLPPGIWMALPGHGAVAASYDAAGIPLPWFGSSVEPIATWRGFLATLPAVAIFLAMLCVGHELRRPLLVILFVAALVNVALGLLQMLGGPESPMRFYAYTNADRGVGLFANSNHYAAFLYSMVPLATAWLLGLIHDRRSASLLSLATVAILYAMLCTGIALSLSRAGLILALVAAVLSLLLVYRLAQGGSGRRVFLIGVGVIFVALVLAAQFGFAGFLRRMEGQGLADLRWPVAVVTWRAAMTYLPFGSGLGSFTSVYEGFAPRTLLGEAYVNHAHDDWLELLLTGGLPAAALLLAFLLWCAVSAFRIWRGRPHGTAFDAALPCAASIVILLLLLHSLLDYPLRTVTLSVVFALNCALMIHRGSAKRPTAR